MRRMPKTANQPKVQATLTYDGFPALDFRELEQDLLRVFRNIAMEMESSHYVSRKHATFIGKTVSARIVREDQDLVVQIEPGNGDRRADVDTRLAACFHVTRHLLTLNRAECVMWHYTGKLYTTEGFEARIAMDSARVSEPAPAPTSNIFVDDRFDVSSTHARLDAALVRRITLPAQDELPGGLAFAGMPVASPAASGGTTRTAPFVAQDIDGTIRSQLREALYPSAPGKKDTIVLFGPGRPEDQLDRSDVVNRLSTYALNTTVMVAALPVGVALMTYNVLGGENLRLTSQVTALTGAFLGLGVGDKLMPFLSMI